MSDWYFADFFCRKKSSGFAPRRERHLCGWRILLWNLWVVVTCRVGFKEVSQQFSFSNSQIFELYTNVVYWPLQWAVHNIYCCPDRNSCIWKGKGYYQVCTWFSADFWDEKYPALGHIHSRSQFCWVLIMKMGSQLDYFNFEWRRGLYPWLLSLVHSCFE